MLTGLHADAISPRWARFDALLPLLEDKLVALSADFVHEHLGIDLESRAAQAADAVMLVAPHAVWEPAEAEAGERRPRKGLRDDGRHPRPSGSTRPPGWCAVRAAGVSFLRRDRQRVEGRKRRHGGVGRGGYARRATRRSTQSSPSRCPLPPPPIRLTTPISRSPSMRLRPTRLRTKRARCSTRWPLDDREHPEGRGLTGRFRPRGAWPSSATRRCSRTLLTAPTNHQWPIYWPWERCGEHRNCTGGTFCVVIGAEWIVIRSERKSEHEVVRRRDRKHRREKSRKYRPQTAELGGVLWRQGPLQETNP